MTGASISTGVRAIVDRSFIANTRATIGVQHMSLIQYVRPFLELGICKEYSMARKTTTTTTTRRKKTEVPAAPAVVQVAPEIQKQAPEEARKDASKIGTLLNQTPVNQVLSLLLRSISRKRFAAGLTNSTYSAERLVEAATVTRIRTG